LNITFGQQCCAFHAICSNAAGSAPTITQARPTSEPRVGRQTECRKIAIANRPAKYFDISAPASARPVSRKSSARPVSRARRYSATTSALNSISGMSVVIATFHAFSGTSSSSVAPDHASASPCRRSIRQPIAATSSGATSAGKRSTKRWPDSASSAASHQPTIGGWS
jgi:hypothetical protein